MEAIEPEQRTLLAINLVTVKRCICLTLHNSPPVPQDQSFAVDLNFNPNISYNNGSTSNKPITLLHDRDLITGQGKGDHYDLYQKGVPSCADHLHFNIEYRPSLR